ncbi:MAG TPA: tRNA lysidine(34) synthetase TilS [Candidatus Saccharimonadales bacterium]|nr:tRNA lysidine(34) synthetase TilS [Candidatus Saccharimonadales bacterium]
MIQKCLVAVSGGVDSVALLDMLVKQGAYELLVAHFDHGIRQDSQGDARFVEALAKKYSLPFFTKREELGPHASEEEARGQRYSFLRHVAKEQGAIIATAHHADDIVETVAINIIRGTGWRGLAVMGAKDIIRPLSTLRKSEIYAYALENRLEWVEDDTNATDKYLRNRVRSQIARLVDDGTKQQLLELWKAQAVCRQEIEGEAIRTLSAAHHSRYFFTCIDSNVALELLRRRIYADLGVTLLTSQLERGLLAIKVALPGSIVQLGRGVELSFSRESFVALQSEKML